MDRTLQTQPAVVEGAEAFVDNNEEHAPEIEKEQRQYRELVPPPPQQPIHMKFDPPVEYDGKSYTGIICDFEKLIGADFIRAEREFRHVFKQATKNEIPFAQMNPDYHAILIARASDMPVGLIKKLPGRYFNILQTEALKVCGSSPEEEKV